MMYFVSREELLFELDRMRDHMFNAIAKCLTDLRKEYLLIFDTLGCKTCPAKNKKGEKIMDKVKTLIEKLWIIADKSENKELLDIAKGLEAYVQKTEDFTEELEGLKKKIDILEERVDKRG